MRKVAEYVLLFHFIVIACLLGSYADEVSDPCTDTAATTNILLDGSNHTDTVNAAVQSGDLVYGNSTPKWDRLAKGTDGKWLKMVSGLPAWTTLPVDTEALLDGANHTDTTNSAVTRGDIVYGNSTPAWDDLAIGSRGKVLTSDGTDISWQIPQRSSPCDERYDVCFFDDMNHRPDDATATGGITNANAGPWAYRNSGTNAIAAPVAGGATVAGGGSGFQTAAYRFDTGSSTGGEACFLTNLASPLGAGNQLDTTPRGKTAFRFSVHTGASLGSVTDRFYFMIGANNSGSCNNTDTSGSVNIELLYADNVNSGKWQAIAKSAAGTSTCDTGVTVATDTTYKGCLVLSADSCTLDVYVTSTLSALDCVDPDNITGSAQCQITGNNIPGCNNAGGAAGLTGYIDINKTAGTNVRVMYVDYFGFYQHSDTAR